MYKLLVLPLLGILTVCVNQRPTRTQWLMDNLNIEQQQAQLLTQSRNVLESQDSSATQIHTILTQLHTTRQQLGEHEAAPCFTSHITSLQNRLSSHQSG